MAEFKHVSIGVLVGILAGGSYYADGQWDPQLMFCLILTWGVAGWLLVRNRRALSNMPALHQILFVGLVSFVPLYSIHPELPLGSLRTVLVLHATGLIAAGIGFGAEIGASSRREQRTTATSPLDE
ncbi:hypothetical protein [Haloferax massiliensis]|uniref:Uncharacterized protein n=1 Tax=Haloferax massiliensis TaxID=1476858 RepID=A0A0D6JVD1_9EURY|nr:hypothetical protein [Haloferax massiliensis]CQR52934.1 hypothetical protein BN996_03375 [Haloferax massiliensis]